MSLGSWARRFQVPRPELTARRWAWSIPEALLLAELSLGLFAALAVYAYRGWFSRYTADDYCTAGLERTSGFISAQIYWYEQWSGRVTYYFVVGVVEFAAPWIAQVLPAIALALWLVLGAWALLPLARLHRWPLPLGSAAVGSGALILVCLSGAPRLDQSLYWQTGMLTYLLPLVLMTAYAGWLAWRVFTPGPRQPTRPEVLISGAFLLAVGGLSEVSLAVQVALLGLATCFASPLLRSERYRLVPLLLGAGLVATVVSGVIVVAAPGNYVHEATVTGTVHPLSQMPLAIKASIDFVGLFARAVEFRARPAAVLLLVLTFAYGAGARLTNRQSRRGWAWYWYPIAILGTVACAWLVLIAASVPGYFAQQWDVPERAQFVGVWVVALALATVGYLAGHAVGEAAGRFGAASREWLSRAAWAAVVLAAAAAPWPSIRDTLALVPADAAYAQDWDSLDATIRSAGPGATVVVDHTLPPHFGFDFLGPDPNFYPNPCVSRFYGVNSITVVPGS